ncbi:T9SS type A sorting domain-containing protein [Ichthyenterobacterium magnum]|uniref:Putative secreted protein (Por secretion system target) n=1 Tax=Ichthyenterobacterium magnum TaxID=1230530 RepID=A0A420DXY7_9FLAO|nr:T9SS type A sorting domain-containing protein [Ichthyenterobacterium magnum]RKE99083.1 putative secreted protein (Por secretion system target) [Ichthyenterobacterium magnum]
MKKSTYLSLLFFIILNNQLLLAQNYNHLVAGSTSPLTGFTNSSIEYGNVGQLIPIDYDVDGDIDFLTLNTTPDGWHLLRNNSGVYTEETTTTVGISLQNASGFVVVDYDNDGDDDIIDPIAGTDNEADIYRNDGGSGFTRLIAGSTSPLTGFTNSSIEYGNVGQLIPIDYDVDGDIDFLTLNTTPDGWHLLRNNSGVYTEETTTTVGISLQNASGFVVVDYDNDGDDDIIDPIAGTDNEADIYQNHNAPPKVMSSNPSDGDIGFEASSNIIITFNENISKGSGNIEIRRVSNNDVVESIDVNTTTVSGATLTINPVNDLIIATDLYIHISAGAIVDADSEIVVSLNNNPETLNFTAVNTLDVNKLSIENSVSLYPNPVKNSLNISTKEISIQRVSLYDVLGKKINQSQFINETIDFSLLEKGMYLLKIETDRGEIIKKVIKQ